MKFLFTLHNFFPEPLFGSETVCVRQMRELLARGDEVGLFCASNKTVSIQKLTEEGLQDLKIYRVGFGPARAQVLLSVWKPHVEAAFSRVLEEFRPDIVIFHHLVRLSMGLPGRTRKAGIPSIYYLHDFYPVCPSYSLLNHENDLCSGGSPIDCGRCLFSSRFPTLPGFVHGIAPFLAVPLLIPRRFLSEHLLQDVDLFVSPSAFLRDKLKELGFNMERCRLIPYPAGSRPIEQEQPKSTEGLTLGYLGKISPKKGVSILVRAFEQLDSVRLIIRGFSDDSEIRRFRQENPRSNAILEKFCSDRSEFFRKIDVLIVPSVWYENQPNVIIEAFIHKVPVICSDLGGMAEMVRDGAWGIVFRPGDARDLAEKVRTLNENPSEVSRMKAAIPDWPTIDEHVNTLLEAANLLVQASKK
ncbi:glycosyltransferase [Desulfomonile tiedjei]|uniref:Glycosyltransferase n=1 Tax=Desulfomonile tiedjei (strain ATCC 49306 / DSM 6799 / DCB-1) TaxID=706587 RepID=I4CAZ7_DESTA|nr:glycosyltransferase [Desulfomonile tiedjei]AFM26738.1 glycosyltransferase [Desulfomonile tiedjei DSM 6799]